MKLAADADGVDAVLAPAGRDSFRCLVDPVLAVAEQWQEAGEGPSRCRWLAETTIRFRVAHEIGHSIFFRPGRPPRRCRPNSPAEETFCDRFALGILSDVPLTSINAQATAAGIMALSTASGLTPLLAAAAMVHSGCLSAVLAGRRDGDIMHIDWSSGLGFDTTGWKMPAPTEEAPNDAWKVVVDDPVRCGFSHWTDHAKTIVAFSGHLI